MNVPFRSLVTVFTALASLAPAGELRQVRPNFVFILVDDLRWDAMSCMGHPFVKTPHIDRLASEGARFTNAFVTTSLCSPSRASFLTGTHAHVHGVRSNEGMDPNPSLENFAQVLQRSDYETAFVGKWHMAPKSSPRPGFDYWLSFKGQGEYVNPTLNENGREFKAEGYMTDLLTRYAVEYIQRKHDKPFAMCLWHKAVHGPFTPAARHEALYKGVAFPEPPAFRDTFEGKPAWQRELLVRGGRRTGARSTATAPARIEPETWNPRNDNRLNYFRTLAAVDDSVGRVLDALREAGHLQNTVVIFAGDNGFFHGEHRRGDKRLAYEESVRIPLLMAGPGVRAESTPAQLALNIDVPVTILQMAGAKIPESMQGRSLAPLLAGENPRWRESFLYTYFREDWLPGVPTMVAVRTRERKYVTYPQLDDLDELYDLSKDPHEMKNLAVGQGSAEMVREMRRELDRAKAEAGFRLEP